MPAVQSPPSRAANSGYIERYGHKFPRDTANDLNIELACYARRNEFPTDQTPEFHFRRAWAIMWPEFEWNEWMDLLVWGWCNYRIICVIGHTRASKSFGTAYISLLDYIAHPFATSTTFTTTKFDALKTRMWSDLGHAIDHCRVREQLLQVFKYTSTSNEMKFCRRNAAETGAEKFAIQGVATDSADSTAGKIRGQHTDRRRIVGDEADDIGDAIYMAIDNAMSAPDFKTALLSQPTERLNEFGKRCAPRAGWSSIHDTDLFWETTQPGGICLHFDGLQSPNIKAGRTVFPYLITQQYIDDQRTMHGAESIEWWMWVRGFPPPDGTVAKIWPFGTIEKAMASCVFDFPPTPFATLDPAFDFDDCVLIIGAYGKLRDGCPCALAKKSIKIKIAEGRDRLLKEQQIADEVMRICKEEKVDPEDFIQDATGNAQGVLALLRTKWSPKVQGCYFGGEATERPLRFNDPKKACDLVRYFVTELWCRASYLAADGMLCGLGKLDKKTVDDLSTRKYTLRQHGEAKKMQAETKEELKKRLGRSPDYGDTFCLIGELMMRRGLLGDWAQGGPKNRWGHSRELARRASRRYEGEFSHGHA